VAGTIATREAVAALLSEIWRYAVTVDQVDRLMVREANPLPYWNPTGGRCLFDEATVRAWATPQGPKQLSLEPERHDARRKR
jgi:hypothetical protein